MHLGWHVHACAQQVQQTIMKDGERWCAELSTGNADLDRQQNWSPEQWELLAENVLLTRQPWKPANFQVSKYFDKNTKKQVTRPTAGQLTNHQTSKGETSIQGAEQGQWRYRYHYALSPNCVNDHPGTLAEAAAKLASTQQPSPASSKRTTSQSSALLRAVDQFPQLLTQMVWPYLNAVERLDLMAVCRQLTVVLAPALKVKHVTHAGAFSKQQPAWIPGSVKTLRISSCSLKHAESVLWPMMLEAVLKDQDNSNGRKRRGAPTAAVTPYDHVVHQLQNIEQLQLSLHSLPTDTRAVWQTLLPQMLPNCTRLRFTIPSRGKVNTGAFCQPNWAQVFAKLSKLTHMELVGPNFSQEMVLAAVASIPSLKVVSVDTEVFEDVKQGVVGHGQHDGQAAKHLLRTQASASLQREATPRKKPKAEALQDDIKQQDVVYVVQRTHAG